MPPLKKKPIKKIAPKTLAEKVGNDLTPQFPSAGGKCDHKAPCFKVVLVTPHPLDTFHHMDEGSAVLFAMRQSRSQGISAMVYGPDGKPVCKFVPRTYDVAAFTMRLTDYNEDHHFNGDKYDARNKAATEARRVARTARENSNPPVTKKKVLKKR